MEPKELKMDLTKVGTCHSCKSNGPLYDDELCPKCRHPQAMMSYENVVDLNIVDIMEKEGFMPVTGWNKKGHVTLLGYVHQHRGPDGWEELEALAEDMGVTNLILGEPNGILFGEEAQ